MAHTHPQTMDFVITRLQQQKNVRKNEYAVIEFVLYMSRKHNEINTYFRASATAENFMFAYVKACGKA